MNTMNNKGNAVRIEYDERDDIFVGHMAGSTISVDACRYSREPREPSSGKRMLRGQPEGHAAALRAAALVGKSLNQWAAKKSSKRRCRLRDGSEPPLPRRVYAYLRERGWEEGGGPGYGRLHLHPPPLPPPVEGGGILGMIT